MNKANVTLAGRAARRVRVMNAWKVRAGVLSRQQLRRWAERVRRECQADPSEFIPTLGLLRR